MLTSIKIEKLFDIFDYDIEFKEEGITILTGPNGYGKTTVLTILDALATQNTFYFINLLFKKITLTLFDGNPIVLEKHIINEVVITIGESEPVTLTSKSEKVDWAEFFSMFSNSLKKDIPVSQELEDKAQTNKFPKLPKFPDVYFIREQRLLRSASDNKTRQINSKGSEENIEIIAFSNTIEEYARELYENIKETLAKSSQINQELDSSFPRRLFDQDSGISEDEFKHRFNKVKDIQKALNEFGLSDIKEDSHPTYKKENANALYVYIRDAEEKLAVFSELLGKLKAFTDILNEHRFTFKRIVISKEDGFKFYTDLGKLLKLSDLSSGEQHEVVLLYELLFKVKPGTLVLIDEPELSLHVVWQKQFLDDLFKIIELQKINIVVATHSPQIINNHWDLTVDLEVLRDAATSR